MMVTLVASHGLGRTCALPAAWSGSGAAVERYSVHAMVRLRPFKLALTLSTIAKVQVDESLIRQASFYRQLLKVLNRFLVKSNSQLLLQALCVGILASLHLGKIIMVAHGSTGICFPLLFVSFPCRNNSYHGLVCAIAVESSHRASVHSKRSSLRPIQFIHNYSVPTLSMKSISH